MAITKGEQRYEWRVTIFYGEATEERRFASEEDARDFFESFCSQKHSRELTSVEFAKVSVDPIYLCELTEGELGPVKDLQKTLLQVGHVVAHQFNSALLQNENGSPNGIVFGYAADFNTEQLKEWAEAKTKVRYIYVVNDSALSGDAMLEFNDKAHFPFRLTFMPTMIPAS